LKRLLSICALLLLFVSCASAPAEPQGALAPDWDVLPAGLTEALCMRLKMDAVATGPVTVVKVTQPLATPHTVGALANISKRRRKTRAMSRDHSAIVNRAIPIALPTGTCTWTPIEVRDIPKHGDEMILELSAPLPNPFEAGEAGVFARVSLAGENASWYWVPLVAQGESWATGMAVSLVL
jgi:hypothetical protein